LCKVIKNINEKAKSFNLIVLIIHNSVDRDGISVSQMTTDMFHLS